MAFLIPMAAAAILGPAYPAASPVERWRPEIAQASRRFGIPEGWIERVILAESGGREWMDGQPTTSKAGAMGLMQLMPGTWQELRRRHRLGHDPHDPQDNILAGTAYLRQMYQLFGYPGLFAAYNAGPARYAAHLDRGTPLPPETRSYLAKVSGPGTDAGTSRRQPGRAMAAIAPGRSTHPSGTAPIFIPLSGAR